MTVEDNAAVMPDTWMMQRIPDNPPTAITAQHHVPVHTTSGLTTGESMSESLFVMHILLYVSRDSGNENRDGTDYKGRIPGSSEST